MKYRYIHLCFFVFITVSFSFSIDFPLIGENGERIYTYGRLNQLTMSKDGNLLASSNTIGSFVWDLRINEDFPIRWLKSNDENHSISAFSPNGKFLFTGNARKQVEIWDITSGERISVLAEISDSIVWIDVSPDNQNVLVAAGTKIIIWNWRDSVIVKEIQLNTTSFGTTYFSPDGTQIISILNRSGNRNDTVAIWDWKSGQILHQFPSMNNVYFKNFSQDGKWVILSGNFGEVVLYSRANYEVFNSFNSTSGIPAGITAFSSSFQISNDGQYLFTINIDDSINKWDIQEKSLIKSYRSHLPSIANQIFLLPAKDSILVNSRSENIKIIDENQDSILGTIGDFPFRVFGANITPDQKLIFDYDPINQVNVRDVITGRKIKQYDTFYDSYNLSFENIKFSNDSAIALFSRINYAAVANVANRSFIYEINDNVFKHADISQDGTLIAIYESIGNQSNSENVIKVIDISTKNMIFQLNMKNIIIRKMELLPDNKHIIFGGIESDVRMWNIETNQEVQVFPGHIDGNSEGILGLELSSDGKKLLTIDSRTNVRLWDVETANIIDQFHLEIFRLFLGIYSVSYNGRYSLYMEYRNSAYSIILRDHALHQTIELFDNVSELSSLHFSSDSLSAVSSSPTDATTRLWDLSAFIDEPSSIYQFEQY